MFIREVLTFLDDELKELKVESEAFHDAIALYDKGDINRANERLVRLVGEGVPNVIGATVYKNGLHYYYDLADALKQFLQYRETMTTDDRIYLAYGYVNMSSRDNDLARTVPKLIEDIAKAGDIRAIKLMAYASYILEQYDDVFRWSKIGRDAGDDLCSYILGHYYLYQCDDDRGGELHTKAVKYLEEARDRGWALNIFDEYDMTTIEDHVIHNGTSVFMERMKKSDERTCMSMVAETLTNIESPYYNPAEGIKACERMIEALKSDLKIEDYNYLDKIICGEIDEYKRTIEELKAELHE